MCDEYCTQLNKLIKSMPCQALAEIKFLGIGGQNTVIDDIESAVVWQAHLPASVARDIELKVLQGDFNAMRLLAYRPKTRFPFTLAARQREQKLKARHDQASRSLDRTREWCLRKKAQGWTMAEILMQEKAKEE